MRAWGWCAIALSFWVGCGDDGPQGEQDAAAPCRVDVDCDDGVFCNGVESCDVALGLCRPGSDPCMEGQRCVAADSSCQTICDGVDDADGDGVIAIECGGEDCDDADADRYPGNTERCDSEGHDEDCDPTTLGADEDGDGYQALACCAANDDGTTRCGSDCDDRSMSVHPEAREICNGADEDCDGAVDEGLPRTRYYPDCDRDSDGAEGSAGELACAVPTMAPPSCAGGQWSTNANDCDDGVADAHIGASPVCGNDVDNDCDGDFDEGVIWCAADGDGDGDYGSTLERTCAAACASGLAPGETPADPDCDDADPDRSHAAAEICNEIDDDCDGEVDGAVTDCDDVNACTVDRCESGSCVHDPDDQFCSDGIACTVEICHPTRGCEESGLDDSFCDDGDPATTDVCSPSGGDADGCVFIP